MQPHAKQNFANGKLRKNVSDILRVCQTTLRDPTAARSHLIIFVKAAREKDENVQPQ